MIMTLLQMNDTIMSVYTNYVRVLSMVEYGAVANNFDIRLPLTRILFDAPLSLNAASWPRCNLSASSSVRPPPSTTTTIATDYQEVKVTASGTSNASLTAASPSSPLQVSSSSTSTTSSSKQNNGTSTPTVSPNTTTGRKEKKNANQVNINRKSVDPRTPSMMSRMPMTTSVVAITSKTTPTTKAAQAVSSTNNSSSPLITASTSRDSLSPQTGMLSTVLSSSPSSSSSLEAMPSASSEVKLASPPRIPSLIQRIMEQHIPYVARSPFVALAGIGDTFISPRYATPHHHLNNFLSYPLFFCGLTTLNLQTT
jgi:hypothetical protein